MVRIYCKVYLQQSLSLDSYCEKIGGFLHKRQLGKKLSLIFMAENKDQSFFQKENSSNFQMNFAEIRNAPTIFQKCHLKEDIY